jgi:hypothetical protein
MDKLITGVLGMLGVVFLLFFLVILTTLGGAVAGWIVGLFFEQTILDTLARFGVNVAGLSMWNLGATLAFVGSFFKAYQNVGKGK